MHVRHPAPILGKVNGKGRRRTRTKDDETSDGEGGEDSPLINSTNTRPARRRKLNSEAERDSESQSARTATPKRRRKIAARKEPSTTHLLQVAIPARNWEETEREDWVWIGDEAEEVDPVENAEERDKMPERVLTPPKSPGKRKSVTPLGEIHVPSPPATAQRAPARPNTQSTQTPVARKGKGSENGKQMAQEAEMALDMPPSPVQSQEGSVRRRSSAYRIPPKQIPIALLDDDLEPRKPSVDDGGDDGREAGSSIGKTTPTFCPFRFKGSGATASPPFLLLPPSWQSGGKDGSTSGPLEPPTPSPAVRSDLGWSRSAGVPRPSLSTEPSPILSPPLEEPASSPLEERAFSPPLEELLFSPPLEEPLFYSAPGSPSEQLRQEFSKAMIDPIPPIDAPEEADTVPPTSARGEQEGLSNGDSMLFAPIPGNPLRIGSDAITPRRSSHPTTFPGPKPPLPTMSTPSLPPENPCQMCNAPHICAHYSYGPCGHKACKWCWYSAWESSQILKRATTMYAGVSCGVCKNHVVEVAMGQRDRWNVTGEVVRPKVQASSAGRKRVRWNPYGSPEFTGSWRKRMREG